MDIDSAEAAGAVWHYDHERQCPDKRVSTYDVIEVCGNSQRETAVDVCIDKSITIAVNGKVVDILSTVSGDLTALAKGYMVCEGYIRSPDDIVSVRYKDDSVNVIVRHTDGPCTRGHVSCKPLMNGPAIDRDVLFLSLISAEDLSVLSKRTDGTHCAIIYTSYGGLVSHAEDIGVLPSIYKAVGKSMLNGYNPGETFLLSSGRISSGMVSAAGRAGIPVVESIAPPSDKAIFLARELGMTIIAYPVLPRMNIYCGHGRITGIDADSAHLLRHGDILTSDLL